MDDARFDAVTRRFTARFNRRTGLGLLASLGAAGLALPGVTDARRKPTKKITICHKGKTIKIDKDKKKQHLKHGDTLGKCKPGQCAGGTKPCDGGCIPKADCCTNGDCNNGDICVNGDCVPPGCGSGGVCTVFVSNASLVGSATGGVAGGDAFCQSTAQTAGLNGTFKAWLSAAGSTPATRFINTANAGPYRLVRNDSDNGNAPPLVADDFADLTTCNGPLGECLKGSINRTETGLVLAGVIAVWTGTTSDGSVATDTCTGWTGAGTGQAGDANQTDADWTAGLLLDCQLDFRFYCFQQA